MFTFQVSWFQALENCEIEGYKLATITSKNDTENLLRNIKEAGKTCFTKILVINSCSHSAVSNARKC